MGYVCSMPKWATFASDSKLTQNKIIKTGHFMMVYIIIFTLDHFRSGAKSVSIGHQSKNQNKQQTGYLKAFNAILPRITNRRH